MSASGMDSGSTAALVISMETSLDDPPPEDSYKILTDKEDMSGEEEGESERDVMTLTRKDDSEDELDQDETDEEDTDIKGTRTVRNCLRSRPCSICMYLCITLLLLASIVALIVIGVLVVAPFHKASKFKLTDCETVSVQNEIEHRRCSCGKGCNSKYPCIKITVRTKVMGGINTLDHVVMYENEANLLRQCSYYPPCKSSRVANEKAVRDYEEKYGKPGDTYSCLYNPKNPTEVIRTRRFHINHVIHGMVWSSLVFVLSLIVLILAIRKKGCDFL